MFSRQILFIRPYLSNSIPVFRHVHIGKPKFQSNNKAFTLTRRNKKDKIDGGALFLLVYTSHEYYSMIHLYIY